MKKKGIVAIIATVSFILVGDVVVSNVALNWRQWTIIFAIGIAIFALYLYLTAEP